MNEPSYYSLMGDSGIYSASDVIELLADMDEYEAWAIGSALAYLIRAGRKTEDPEEDLRKARTTLVMAVEHRFRRGW